LARRSVSLSASITAVGTLLSLLTIPTWMLLAPTISDVAPAISVVPAKTILSQLFALMVLPMAAGMILRSVLPAQIEHHSKLLRLISLSFALFILFLVIWSTQQTLAELAIPVLIGATLFIIGGMTCGWVLSYGLAEEDRSVLIIESGVRNIGVALLLGRTILNTEQFGQLATFLAAYFAVEIVIMLAFAHYLASKP
jgi:BASS family bile acid:Na+ symporter